MADIEGIHPHKKAKPFQVTEPEAVGLASRVTSPQLFKVAKNRADQSNITGCSMKDMPWDVLTEIFKFAHPLDLLSLSRTSKALRGFLMSRKSAFVWKAARERESAAQVARERVSYREIPECPPELSEAQYAVLLFTSECTVCGEPGVPGTMWELLARYCPECKERDLVSIEQIRAVKRIVWDVIDYSKPIFLHGQTFFGGVWLYDESGVFPRHKIREFGKSYVACRTPDEKDKLLEGLHAQHVRLSNLGIRLRGWGTSEDERRRQEIDVIKKKRAEKIIERLREAGWGEELDKMSPRRMSALRRLGIVDKGVPLTDERWEGIRDPLMQHMEFVQACRLNREWQAVVLERLRWLQGIVADDTSITSARRDSTEYGMGGDLRVEFSDVAMFPELRTLLEAPAADEIKKEDLAERCIRCLPVLKDKWMRQREAYFNDLVRQAPRATPLPDGLVASLAIVTFTCKRCTCPWIRWPDVSNHHCGRMEPYYRGDKDDTPPYTDVLALFCQEKHLTLPWHFDPEYEVEFASEATEGVIRLCGYDPLRTSYKEMQDCGVRLHCKTCAVFFDGYLEVYDWQNAEILHSPRRHQYAHGGGSRTCETLLSRHWAVLDAENTALVVSVERAEREVRGWRSWHRLYRCERCGDCRSRNGIFDHCERFHGIRFPPTVRVDFSRAVTVELCIQHGAIDPILLYPEAARTNPLAVEDAKACKAAFSPALLHHNAGRD